jgi:hypothetical protein
LFEDLRRCRIHDVQQQISVRSFRQGCLKRFDQFVGQVADETDRIGQRDRGLRASQPEAARGGVQCGKQLVCRKRL